MPKARSKFIADNNLPSLQPPHVPTWHSGLPLPPHQASVPPMESPSSPTAPKHPTGAIHTGPVKNQDTKPSFVSKILQKKFQKRTSSLQEFSIPDGSTQVDHEQEFDHQHFSCKDARSRGTPQEYRLPPPFAPGYSWACRLLVESLLPSLESSHSVHLSCRSVSTQSLACICLLLQHSSCLVRQEVLTRIVLQSKKKKTSWHRFYIFYCL